MRSRFNIGRGLIGLRRLAAWVAIITLLVVGGAWNAQRNLVEQYQAKCWAKRDRHFHVHYNRNHTRDAVCWNARANRVEWKRPL